MPLLIRGAHWLHGPIGWTGATDVQSLLEDDTYHSDIALTNYLFMRCYIVVKCTYTESDKVGCCS